MPRVPHNHVPVLDHLKIEESIDISPRQCRIGGEALAIIDLRGAMVQKNPHVPDSIGVRATIVCSRNEQIAFARNQVSNPPVSISGWLPQSANLEMLRVPVRITYDRRIVELLDDIMRGRANVEIEPPIGVVMMDFASAVIVDSRKSEARTDGSVGVETPLTDVTVPTRLHLAD